MNNETDIANFNLKNVGDCFYLDEPSFPQYKDKLFYFSYPDGDKVLSETNDEHQTIGIVMKNQEDNYLLDDTVFIQKIGESFSLLLNVYINSIEE